jgi:hypothetical protein
MKFTKKLFQGKLGGKNRMGKIKMIMGASEVSD